MAFQRVEEGIQVNFHHRVVDGGDKEFICGLAFTVVSTLHVPSVLDDIAAGAQSSWEANFTSRTPPEFELFKVTVRDLEEEFGYLAIHEDPTPGTAAFATMGLNSAIVTTFICAGGSAPRRGRVFFPWVPENAVDQLGLIDSITTDLMTDKWEDLANTIRQIPSVDGDHVVISRYHSVVNPDPPPARITVLRDEGITAPVASYITRSYVGSQRDRRLGI